MTPRWSAIVAVLLVRGAVAQSPSADPPAPSPPLAFSPDFPAESPSTTQPDSPAPVLVKLAMLNKDELEGRLMTLGGGTLTIAPSVSRAAVLTARLERVARLTVEQPQSGDAPATQSDAARPDMSDWALQTLRLADGSVLRGWFVALTAGSLRFEIARVGTFDLPRAQLLDWTCSQRPPAADPYGGFGYNQLQVHGNDLRIFPVKRADAQEVARCIDALFEGIRAPGDRQAVQIVADHRTNCLLASGATREQFKLIEDLLRQLDGDDGGTWPVMVGRSARRARPPGGEALHVVRTRTGDRLLGDLAQAGKHKLTVSGAAVEATLTIDGPGVIVSIEFPPPGAAPTTQPETAAWAVETADGMRLVGRELELRGGRLWLIIAGENRVSWPMAGIKSLSPATAGTGGLPVISPGRQRDTLVPWDDSIPIQGWERRVRPGEEYFEDRFTDEQEDAVLYVLFGNM